MGLRLPILSWWTPKYIIRKEPEIISDKTRMALKSLVSKYTAKTIVALKRETAAFKKRRLKAHLIEESLK